MFTRLKQPECGSLDKEKVTLDISKDKGLFTPLNLCGGSFNSKNKKKKIIFNYFYIDNISIYVPTQTETCYKSSVDEFIPVM